MTGYTADEVIGSTPRILNSGQHDQAFYQDMWQTIESGRVWSGKIIDRRKDGSFFPASLTISPVRDPEHDTHTHYIGIQSDLTRLEDMQHKFHQAQKMEAIGTLVSGIAHDFNNILAGITGNLHLIKNHPDLPAEATARIGQIEELCFRSADMIQQLLTFVRKDQIHRHPMQLSPLVRESMRLLRASVPENIDLELDLCRDPLPVNGDKTQLHQVLMNLVHNARDAVEGCEHPRITIRLESCLLDDAFAHSHPPLRPGEYARLSVTDNGEGIPADQLEHLFEPFFTTKDSGNGLGLAMVYGAIENHQGYIDVESEPGRGSCFHIYIPLLETIDEEPCPSGRRGPHGQGETLLLADDEEHVQQTTAEVLEAMGYRILQAGNGRQALACFHAHRGQIALAIVDMVMPEMDGETLLRQMRKQNPHLPVIFITGYDQGKLRDRMPPRCTVMNKPLRFGELAETIRAMLDRPD